MLRNVGEALTSLKKQFIETKGVPFVGEIHAEIGKTVPKLATSYRRVETAFQHSITDFEKLKPIAVTVDDAWSKYEVIQTWYKKNPGPEEIAEIQVRS